MESQCEYIHFPLEEFNHGAQLVAIRGLLYRQERADQEISDRIKEADAIAMRTRDRANDHAVDVWVELAEMSCYQDAAHSMAAVGMIAPPHRIGLSGSISLHRERIAPEEPR